MLVREKRGVSKRSPKTKVQRSRWLEHKRLRRSSWQGSRKPKREDRMQEGVARYFQSCGEAQLAEAQGVTIEFGNTEMITGPLIDIIVPGRATKAISCQVEREWETHAPASSLSSAPSELCGPQGHVPRSLEHKLKTTDVTNPSVLQLKKFWARKGKRLGQGHVTS